MEHLFGAFLRVQRGLDDVPHLLESFQAFENNPSGASAQDLIRLLDLPPRSVQDENIADVTTLTKHELLKRAAESPKELTRDEINLLLARYWTHVTCPEQDAYLDALGALEEVSVEYCNEMMERLKRFQKPLYEENEAEAIENATNELHRRGKELRQTMRQSDLDVVFERGKPWLRQLWQEDQAQKVWGFATFENPQFAADDRRQSYVAEQREALRRSLKVLGAGIYMGGLWQVESPNWPTQTGGDESFPAILDGLRRKFKQLRAQPSMTQPIYPRDGTDPIYERVTTNDEKWGHNLSDGVLRNVFLYLDQESAASVLHSHGFVNRMWIWAVDPDYEPSNNTTSGYQGYLRVRLQQLVDNFYTARRWHADDLSMEDLWRAAQKGPNDGAFVSVKEEEIFSAEPGIDTRSRIGAPPPRK
ncbi:hypothetical protein VTN00DRAFT_9049 [Thermoascus crustaceus]|uniref:uncharacterized protein n=1 Tax=Thermoascus crustaceus TaxID=5088 RepID=UPI003743388C